MCDFRDKELHPTLAELGWDMREIGKVLGKTFDAQDLWEFRIWTAATLVDDCYDKFKKFAPELMPEGFDEMADLAEDINLMRSHLWEALLDLDKMVRKYTVQYYVGEPEYTDGDVDDDYMDAEDSDADCIDDDIVYDDEDWGS